jgi:hypothetical protein
MRSQGTPPIYLVSALLTDRTCESADIPEYMTRRSVNLTRSLSTLHAGQGYVTATLQHSHDVCERHTEQQHNSRFAWAVTY